MLPFPGLCGACGHPAPPLGETLSWARRRRGSGSGWIPALEPSEGRARLPNVVDLASIEDIERCVLDSCFTHVNHKQTLKGGADDKAHMAYWRAKQRTGEGVRVRELVYWGRVEDAFRG